MTRVIDTSVVVKWFVAEDGQGAAEALIGSALIAPDILLAEVANAVWKKWRKGELHIEQVRLALATVNSFVEVLPSRAFADDALSIALELKHPVYDCYYLALCDRTGHNMITADARLIMRCADTRFHAMLETL